MSSLDELAFGADAAANSGITAGRDNSIDRTISSHIQPPSKPKRTSTLRSKSRSNCFSKGLIPSQQSSVQFSNSRPSECFKIPTNVGSTSPKGVIFDSNKKGGSQQQHYDIEVVDDDFYVLPEEAMANISSIANATSWFADWLSRMQSGSGREGKCPINELINSLIKSNKMLHDPILLDYIEETINNFMNYVETLISSKNTADDLEEHHNIRLSQMNKLVNKLQSDLTEIEVTRRMVHDNYTALKEKYDCQVEDIRSYEEQISELNISIAHLKRKNELEKVFEATKYRGTSPWLSGFHELSQSIHNTTELSDDLTIYDNITSRSHYYATTTTEETNLSAISPSHSNIRTPTNVMIDPHPRPTTTTTTIITDVAAGVGGSDLNYSGEYEDKTKSNETDAAVYPLGGVVHHLGITATDIERLNSRDSMYYYTTEETVSIDTAIKEVKYDDKTVDIENFNPLEVTGKDTITVTEKVSGDKSELMEIESEYPEPPIIGYNFSDNIEPIIRSNRLFHSSDTSNTYRDNNVSSMYLSLSPSIRKTTFPQKGSNEANSQEQLQNDLLKVSLELGLDPINQSPDPLKWLDGLNIDNNSSSTKGYNTKNGFVCPRCGYIGGAKDSSVSLTARDSIQSPHLITLPPVDQYDNKSSYFKSDSPMTYHHRPSTNSDMNTPTDCSLNTTLDSLTNYSTLLYMNNRDEEENEEVELNNQFRRSASTSVIHTMQRPPPLTVLTGCHQYAIDDSSCRLREMRRSYDSLLTNNNVSSLNLVQDYDTIDKNKEDIEFKYMLCRKRWSESMIDYVVESYDPNSLDRNQDQAVDVVIFDYDQLVSTLMSMIEMLVKKVAVIVMTVMIGLFICAVKDGIARGLSGTSESQYVRDYAILLANIIMYINEGWGFLLEGCHRLSDGVKSLCYWWFQHGLFFENLDVLMNYNLRYQRYGFVVSVIKEIRMLLFERSSAAHVSRSDDD